MKKQVIEVFKSLDAKFIDSKADLSAVFYIYPYYPVTISIWFEDEEFPSTGKNVSRQNSRPLSYNRRCSRSWGAYDKNYK